MYKSVPASSIVPIRFKHLYTTQADANIADDADTHADADAKENYFLESVAALDFTLVNNSMSRLFGGKQYIFGRNIVHSVG